VQTEAGAGQRILHRDAVEQIGILIGAAAAQVNLIVSLHHPHLAGDNVLHVFDNLLLDLRARHAPATRGLFQIKQRPLADHHHFLAERQHRGFELEVQRRGGAGGHFHAGMLHLFVADHRGLDGVNAGIDVENFEAAVDFGGRTIIGAFDQHVHARQTFAGFLVGDAANE